MLILAPTRKAVDHASQNAQARESQTDAIASSVQRRIRAQERKDSDDSTDVAKAYLPRTTDRPTMVASKVHVEPADYDRHGCVGAHCHQE